MICINTFSASQVTRYHWCTRYSAPALAKRSKICPGLTLPPILGDAAWSSRDARASRVGLTPKLTLVQIQAARRGVALKTMRDPYFRMCACFRTHLSTRVPLRLNNDYILSLSDSHVFTDTTFLTNVLQCRAPNFPTTDPVSPRLRSGVFLTNTAVHSQQHHFLLESAVLALSTHPLSPYRATHKCSVLLEEHTALGMFWKQCRVS
jgi:hypothetical protein